MTADCIAQAIHQQGVLVVEDSTLQRKTAIEVLRQLGIGKIYEAADGKSALSVLRSLFLPPAIIVVDLEMPGMDGIELVQHMSSEGLRSPLLVVSGAEQNILSSVEAMIEALGMPLLGSMSKPITHDKLSEAISRYESLSPRRGNESSRIEKMPGVAALGAAIDAGRIRPHYQPKISLVDGSVVGFEALARWYDDEERIIPPGQFIELAEQHALIDLLSLSMLDHVLNDLEAWHRQGLYPGIALNISAKSLARQEFGNEIIHRVNAARISPSSLVLEVTESALVSDMASALGVLGRLRLKGFGLAIDDYGTGFSSMQQLYRLPFTELKIDRSFVSHAHEMWNKRAILQSAVEVGHRLGLSTIAEGVETREDLDLLKSLGCQQAQGYLIAAPMPFLAVHDWMDLETERLRALCERHAEPGIPLGNMA